MSDPNLIFELRDISRQTFGKYQHCTEHEGRWFSDFDFDGGQPKEGAIPSPMSEDRTPYRRPRWYDAIARFFTGSPHG